MMNRREFHRQAAMAAAAASLVAGPVARAAGKPIQAVAFDAFPIFDPRPIFALAEELYPGQGQALGKAWRTRQFEYQWLRALAGQYVDFWQATEDGLVFAAREMKIDLPAENRDRLMGAYLKLEAWPDVVPALKQMKEAGIRLAFLSNMTAKLLETNAENAGVAAYFEHIISTDRAKTYKPDPKAYQLGVDVLGLPKEQIAFAAFAGWDAAGAKWFGYPTFWVNRAGFQEEELGVEPDGTGKSLGELSTFVSG